MRKSSVDAGRALSGRALQTATQASYHGSRFDQIRLFTSDRSVPLGPGMTRPGGNPLGEALGLEIETSSGSIRNNDTLTDILLGYVFPQSGFPADFFRIEHDGSLTGNSTAECVTQTMTPAALRNLYPAFKCLWAKYFSGLGIMPNDSCGMHVNLSNGMFGLKSEPRELAIRKLAYIVNHHYRLIAVAVNRDLRYTTYCGQMSVWADKATAKTRTMDAWSNHSVSYNLGHYDNGADSGRVELRLVGPQTSYPCFRNSMEVVLHLVKAAKKLSWADCDYVSKIFSGCNQYVFDRLKSNVRNAGLIDLQTLEDIRPTVKHVELV